MLNCRQLSTSTKEIPGSIYWMIDIIYSIQWNNWSLIFLDHDINSILTILRKAKIFLKLFYVKMFFKVKFEVIILIVTRNGHLKLVKFTMLF